MSNGNWHCGRCMQTYENYVHRFIISETVANNTCTIWVSIFNKQAEVELDGAEANDLYAITNANEKD